MSCICARLPLLHGQRGANCRVCTPLAHTLSTFSASLRAAGGYGNCGPCPKKPGPMRREKLLPAPRKDRFRAARATMTRKCFGTRSRNGVETPKPVATSTAAAQPLISRQLATPRTAFRSKPRCLDPPMSRKPTFRHNSQHRELRFALNRDTASPRTETNAAAQALISQQALRHCSPPLRSKPRCCEFSTPRQAQSKRLDAPIRWQQCPFWPKWDELPAMLDALASPTLTNRSHFGQLFPPNLALRRFANICKV